MRIHVSVFAVLLGSAALGLMACSNDDGSNVGTLPQSAEVQNDERAPSEGANSEGSSPSTPLAAGSGDAGSSIPPSNPPSNAGAKDAGASDASADEPDSDADAGTYDAGSECNALARQSSEAPYYAQFGGSPDLGTYSGGVIQDGTYVLTEDRRYLGQPTGPDGGGVSTGTSWTTLQVKGNVLTAVVTDRRGGELRFNATIALDGASVTLTQLCGLDQPAETNEWKELFYPFTQSGYTATDDTFSVAWKIGNHGAVAKVFHRVN